MHKATPFSAITTPHPYYLGTVLQWRVSDIAFPSLSENHFHFPFSGPRSRLSTRRVVSLFYARPSVPLHCTYSTLFHIPPYHTRSLSTPFVLQRARTLRRNSRTHLFSTLKNISFTFLTRNISLKVIILQYFNPTSSFSPRSIFPCFFLLAFYYSQHTFVVSRCRTTPLCVPYLLTSSSSSSSSSSAHAGTSV